MFLIYGGKMLAEDLSEELKTDLSTIKDPFKENTNHDLLYIFKSKIVTY